MVKFLRVMDTSIFFFFNIYLAAPVLVAHRIPDLCNSIWDLQL